LKEIFFALLAAFALLVAFIFFEATVTTTFYKESGKPIREIDLAQMKQLKRGQLTIYFFPEHQTLGQEVADVLEQAWRIVRERLALDLGRFGVAVVVPKAGEEIGGVRLQRKIWALWDPIVPVLTSPNLQSLQQADRDTLIQIYWAMAHEAMELNVLKKLYHDPAARWIGDGLAEYVGYTITSELAPHVREEMLAIRRRNVQLGLVDQGYMQYDLTKEFLVIRGKSSDHQGQWPAGVTADPGYGVALTFWLQIAQKHGEGVIKTFWQRTSQRGFPTAKEAARILSELTGEDIWAKLQKMDLHEVLRTLEQAGALAQP
jgi:hypothetical protein